MMLLTLMAIRFNLYQPVYLAFYPTLLDDLLIFPFSNFEKIPIFIEY